MAFSEKIFEVITPKSVSDTNFSDHEYKLEWIGGDGGKYEFMFTDRLEDTDINATPINTRKGGSLKSIVSSVGQTVTLYAEDLSDNDLDVISTLLMSPEIRRLKIDGTLELLTVERNSFNKRKSGIRYNINFTVRKCDLR